MRNAATLLLCAALAAAITADVTLAKGDVFSWKPRQHRRDMRERSFQRVATFGNYLNNADASDETVSEIVSATADGRTLVYTDAVLGEVGFVDITNPANPRPAGKLSFDPDPQDDVDYEPTSVDILGNRYALVAVNTSRSNVDTSGTLFVVDLSTHAVVRELDLGGQPDSIHISPDGKYAAVAIENERSETLCAGGASAGLEVVEDDDDYVPGTNTTEDLCADGGGVVGGLPQTPYGNPAGYLSVIRLSGPPAAWTRNDVALTGLSDYAPDDPEPEFVDINERNEAVVTLQENNWVVVVDLARRTITRHFPAGTVTLTDVDATEDGVIRLTETLADVAREPDAVAWVPGVHGRFDLVTANEGDLFGGSRGFTIFKTNGAVAFDSGSSLDRLAVQYGHYPEDRSENKGTEPEAVEYARFGTDDYLFVGSERGNFVAVYTLDRLGRPRFSQLLPGPLGPEGLLAIPQRNLLVVSGEVDDPTFGVRSTVMIYALKKGEADTPQVVSDDSDGTPLPWSALSGLTAIPGDNHALLGVWDSYYAESRILRLDVSDTPAVITDAITIQGGRGNYDLEGITIAPDKTMWLASEGNASDSRPNLLIQVNGAGQVLQEVGLPAEILACRTASRRRGTLGSGFEGVAAVPGAGGGYVLLVAQQRGWDYTTPACEALDDDEGGFNASNEPNRTRIWIYDPQARSWSHVAWELAPKPANATWVGLSEVTRTPAGDIVVLERDNLTGDFGTLKTLVKVAAGAFGDGLIAAGEKSTYDLLPQLLANHGWITDKPEGVAVTDEGRTFVVTDNDGVEDWSGETWFLRLGREWKLFR